MMSDLPELKQFNVETAQQIRIDGAESYVMQTTAAGRCLSAVYSVRERTRGFHLWKAITLPLDRIWRFEETLNPCRARAAHTEP